MKKLTLLLSVVLVVLLGIVMVFYVGGTLSARPSVHSAAAADYPEAYKSIRGVLDSGAAPQVFDGAALPESPDGVSLVDVTIDLNNRGLFPAEWLDARAVPVPGDIAVYSLSGVGSDVDARGVGQANLKLVTTADPAVQRFFEVQYYVYGMKRSLTVRVN